MAIDHRRHKSSYPHGPYIGAGHAAIFTLMLWLALGIGILWRLAH